jgi:uncharacterized protein (TIGR00369 family)
MHPAQALLASLPFNKLVGLSVDVVEEGHGVVTLADRPELHNHIGTPHAGALFTIAESASGAAILGAFGDKLGELTPLALKANIEYLKVARGALTATARMRTSKAETIAQLASAEKGVSVEVDVVITDSNGVEATKMTVAWYLKKNR